MVVPCSTSPGHIHLGAGLSKACLRLQRHGFPPYRPIYSLLEALLKARIHHDYNCNLRISDGIKADCPRHALTNSVLPTGVKAGFQPGANISVTLDIFNDGMTLYKVSCETANQLPCNLSTPFSVVITVTSEELVGGNVTFMGGNASVNPNDTQVVFDEASGNLTFTVGPISFAEEIESGGIRQLEFQLVKEVRGPLLNAAVLNFSRLTAFIWKS